MRRDGMNGVASAWPEMRWLRSLGVFSVLIASACGGGDNPVQPPGGGTGGRGGNECQSDCTVLAAEGCGDGGVAGEEFCDDAGESRACNADCSQAQCGDTVLNFAAGERCDDGNSAGGDGCSPLCQLEIAGACGNSLLEADEECDSGMQTDSCDTDCSLAVCGDGVSNGSAGESCDDGNTDAGDGCSPTCGLEIPADCGNGVLDEGELCDESGAQSSFCNTDCTLSACGDGKLNPEAGETCDDGNSLPGDGCSETCVVEAPSRCGNGVPEAREQCDDGNRENGDGCSSDCAFEEEEKGCGNGFCDGAETCAADSCQSDCGKCPSGSGCSSDSDCPASQSCKIGSLGGFECVPDGSVVEPMTQPRLEIEGLDCAISIGSVKPTDGWIDNMDGTFTLGDASGTLTIGTPLGNIVLTGTDSITYNSNTHSFSMDAEQFPIPGFESIPDVFKMEANTSALFTIEVLSGEEANEALGIVGGREKLPSDRSYMLFSIANPASFSLSDVVGPGSDGTSLDAGSVKDGSGIRFFLEPCDPLFAFHTADGQFVEATQGFDGVAMSVGGNILLDNSVDLWDGSQSTQREGKGNGFIQGTFTLPKIGRVAGQEILPTVDGAALVDFDPAKNGVLAGEVFDALLAGEDIENAFSGSANNTDFGLSITGALDIPLPIPDDIRDIFCADFCPETLPLADVSAYSAVGCQSNRGGSCSSGDELLFAGQSSGVFLEGSVFEEWFPPRPGGQAIQGYVRGADDWGYRTQTTLNFFGSDPSFEAEVLLQVSPGSSGPDVLFQASGQLVLDVLKIGTPETGYLEVDLGHNQFDVLFEMDWGRKMMCGEIQADVQGLECKLGICAGEGVFEVEAECPLTVCGDGVCEGLESCYEASCQEDCGECPAGVPCTLHEDCQSGLCPIGVCMDCVQDADCPSGEFCSDFDGCKAPGPYGDQCTAGSHCESGRCGAGFCVDCSADNQCPSSEHCNLVGQCITDLDYGAVCTADAECKSGRCGAGICVECEADNQCGASRHCDVAGKCKNDLSNGSLCTSDLECVSNVCGAAGVGTCVQCRNNSGCAGSQFCDALSGSCKSDKPYGGSCSSDTQCTSNRCGPGSCVECKNDGQCVSSQHCNLSGRCVNDLGFGSVCMANAECLSNKCSGTCYECTADSQCPSSEHCNVNRQCIADLSNGGICTADAECRSGQCALGLCAECDFLAGDGCGSGESCVFGNVCRSSVEVEYIEVDTCWSESIFLPNLANAHSNSDTRIELLDSRGNVVDGYYDHKFNDTVLCGVATPAWIRMEAAGATRLRLTARGGDALLVDRIAVKYRGQSVKWAWADLGGYQCLSTQSSDNLGDEDCRSVIEVDLP